MDILNKNTVAKLFFEKISKTLRDKNILVLSAEQEFLQYMSGFVIPQNIRNHHFIDNDKFLKCLKLIWHAVASAQIELANSLMFLEDIKTASTDEEKVQSSGLCSHHLSLTYECIYRVWERISQTLGYLHYKEIRYDTYYNNIVEIISKSKRYDNRAVNVLKKNEKHWCVIANQRNQYSHGESNLFKYDFEFSLILNSRGLPAKIFEKTLDLKQECQTLIDRFMYLKKLNSNLLNFINLFPSSPIIN